MEKYKRLDQILNHQFLGDTPLSDFLYKRIIKKSLESKNSLNENSHIFISGLARSGTTALLNKIYASGEVGSFLYKYMPFILSPRFASIFSNFVKNDQTTIERFHKDGIKINQNSPECLDEVFWIKSKLSDSTFPIEEKIIEKILISYSYLLNEFARIQKKERMVVKNNNNHFRLKSLLNYFPNSYFLLIFRDPLSHSSSLLSQHKNFLKIHNQNAYTLEYMNLIGHNEFGGNMKPFLYSNNDNDNDWCMKFNNLNINYWLMQWIESHQWFLKSGILKKNNLILVNYKNLCKEKDYFKKLCKKIKIKNNSLGNQFILKKKYITNSLEIDSSILGKAQNIYEELLINSFKNQ
tara:strand:+ start:2412 stop:3464 length:1053 start_codon:yes stop_codon:yes gene_type:complete